MAAAAAVGQTTQLVGAGEDPDAVRSDEAVALRPSDATLTAAHDLDRGPDGLGPIADEVGRRREYHCACGHRLWVSGGGRHRVYFEPGAAGTGEPVMNRRCPSCAGGLPGKNPL